MKTRRIVALSTFGVVAILAGIFHSAIVAWFTGQRSGGSAGTAVTIQAGAWNVGMTLDPDPPREREQRAIVSVVEKSAGPVDGADVEITYDMPAMGGMAEMKSSFPAKSAGRGSYEATFDLPMGGSWGLWVRVTAGGGCAVARFKLTVGQTGLTADGAGGCVADKTIQIDEQRQKEIGITTAVATRGPMALGIRAVGRVTYDESRLTDVVLKVGGYVSGLRVRAVGQPVVKGETLFLVYSPDLLAAQQDYLVARSSKDLMGSGTRGDGLVRAAEKKLELLGLSRAQIEKLAETGAPIEKLAFGAPASGSVIEKTVVEGDAVQAGQRLFRIAALDKIWVEADLFEADLGRVTAGMPASVALGTGQAFDGKVAFVYPALDPQTRTGRVRIELPNKGLELKPDMYATVTFAVTLADRLQVPTSAVVFTGPRRLVYVELGGGKIEPREVELGARGTDKTEIVKGLRDGEVVVASGNFLVAAESRIRGVQ